MGGSSGPPGGGYVPRTPRPPRGGGGGEGGPDGGDDPCSFTITTSLASPNPQVVEKINEGNVLHLVLNEGGAVPIVEARFEGDEVAGTIAGIPNLRALIGCMKLGVNYDFKVKQKTGGRVDGVIRNV